MTISAPMSISVSEQAYRALRADILFARLKPGERLRLERMKDHYAVGVSTLREILSRLASEGFVVAEGQRGFEVAPVSLKGMQEIAELRKLIEIPALEKSFREGDVDWEAGIVAAHHRLVSVERGLLAGRDDKAGDTRAGEVKTREDRAEAWKAYDLEFHRALIAACGSAALMEVHGLVCDKYFRYLMVALVMRGAVTGQEHDQLLACALSRDIVQAVTILTGHIDGCVSFAVTQGHLK